MKELTRSKKSTAYRGKKEKKNSSTPPEISRPIDGADDCSCICQRDESMSGIHSAHRRM